MAELSVDVGIGVVVALFDISLQKVERRARGNIPAPSRTATPPTPYTSNLSQTHPAPNRACVDLHCACFSR
jgi:hypothetical protein